MVLAHFAMFRNRVDRLDVAGQFKIAFLTLVALFFLAGIYAGCWRLVSYINGVAVIGPLLVNKLLGLVFLTSFSMVVMSGLITSFTTIFSSEDLPWLIEKPIPIEKIFILKALATCLYSSWMVILLLSPLLLALGQVKQAPLSFYPFSIIIITPFLFIASSLGIMGSAVLMRFLPSRRTRDILLLCGILLVTALYVLFRLLEPERLVRLDGLEVVAQYLAYLNAPTAVYLPSWWVAAALFSFLTNAAGDTFFYAALLYGAGLVIFILVVLLAKRYYYHGWSEGRVYGRVSSPARFSFNARSPLRAIIEKDGITFLRDAAQWSQLLLLASLVVVYIFSIYKLPLDTLYLQNLVAFLNIGLIGFIMAAVALRFIFPSVSLEGMGISLLRASPVSMAAVLGGKLFFGLVPLAGFGILMAVSSCMLLKADMYMVILSLAAVGVMAVGLGCLAAGFGAMFPVFSTANVARIESSGGGLFFIITALAYIGLSLGLWAAPVQDFYRHKFGAQGFASGYGWWVAGGLVLINLLVTVVPLRLGYRSLEERQL